MDSPGRSRFDPACHASGQQRRAWSARRFPDTAVLALMNMPYEPTAQQLDLCDTALDLLAEVEDATHKPVYVLPDWCPPGRSG